MADSAVPAQPSPSPPPPSSESDEDEEAEEVKAKLAAEYYDNDGDDHDEAWVQKQRQGRKSDAILSCPACFTQLCIDCQRHEKYVNQYRAMFVTNCKIVENERLRLPARPQIAGLQGRKGRRRRNRKDASTSTGPATVVPEEEVYKPVRCSVCDTEVAMLDKDEVYHFFNIIPSYS